MSKIILRSGLGALFGLVIYALIASSQGGSFGELMLFVSWGIGMANSFSVNLRLLGGAFRWATNLGILSYLSFGSGVFGIIALLFMLCIVLGFGWIYGWFLLVRDIVAELH